MRPRNSNLESRRPGFPQPSRTPRWLLIVSVVTMLLILGMGYISLRVVQRIRQFKSLASEIQTAYQTADSRTRFAPPEAPRLPAPDRISGYFRARESFFAAASPEVESRTRSMLVRRRNLALGDTLRLAGTFHEFLRDGAHSHLTTLEEVAMSPSEFFWIHTIVVRSVLESPPEDSRRRRLEETLEALESSAAPISGTAQSFSAEEFRGELDHYLDNYPLLESGSFTEFRIEGDLMACMDIIAATGKLREALAFDAPTAASPPQAALTPPTTFGV